MLVPEETQLADGILKLDRPDPIDRNYLFAMRLIEHFRSFDLDFCQRLTGTVLAGHELLIRHSYARHLLLNGIQINYLSRWLGHSSIQITLIYLELVPGP